jgi:hypothetical protein
LANTLMGLAIESSATVTPSLTAVGGSLTGVTVMVTFPVSLRAPSKTVYVNSSVPWKLAAGV